jgi:hypothetical protein
MDYGIIKLINRVLHLTSTGLLAGAIIFNYLYSSEELLSEETKYETFMSTTGLVSFITGLISRIVIPMDKEIKQGSTASMWKHIFELKFFLSLFLTPAIKPLLHSLNAMELLGSSQKEQDDFKKTF